jgi:spore coat protein U-like protein
MTDLKNSFNTCSCEGHRGAANGLFNTALGVGGLLLVMLSQASLADCNISATPVAFGSYDVFAVFPNDNGFGTLTVVCGGGAGNNYPVTLSMGQSGSYTSRVMTSGANLLNYNLYTDPARTSIWGDGSGGSSFMTVRKNDTTNLSVYGRIPAMQDAAVGTYTDSIIATVTF